LDRDQSAGFWVDNGTNRHGGVGVAILVDDPSDRTVPTGSYSKVCDAMYDNAMTYDQFWLQYLRAHTRPATRLLHYLGSLLAIVCLALAVLRREWWWLPAAPIVGYAFAWGGHLAIEGNRPQSFGHPFWSLASDCRMLGLWVMGLLEPQLERSQRSGSV
jgi:hypothetical protein